MMRQMMRVMVGVVLAMVMALPVVAEEMKISLFETTIFHITRTRPGYTVADVAGEMKRMGITGFDAYYGNPRMNELIAAGLTPANFYGFVRFLAADGGEKEGDGFLAAAVKYGAKRIMVIPDTFPKEMPDAERDRQMTKIIAGMNRLVAKAQKRGIEVNIEDFGNRNNSCSEMRYLKRFLKEVPGLGFAVDSGNLHCLEKDEDILELLDYAIALGRVRHVHLKDHNGFLGRTVDEKYVTLGKGDVPNREIVRRVLALGYEGWWTLENPVGDDYLADVRRQVATLKRWAGEEARAQRAMTNVTGGIEKVALETGWKFVKGDDAGWKESTFDDALWRTVRVPHDWGIEKGFDAKRPYGDGFLDSAGTGWYRKHFTMPAAWRGKCVYFECDGAMSHPRVWINGQDVGGWAYGYTRFRVDVTKHLKAEGDNVLAVRCCNLPDSSRWYTGGGLYRRCRLLVCPKDHVVPGSVFIRTPQVTKESATVRVTYRMSVSGARERVFTVKNPRLWDIDDPYLYVVNIEGNDYRYGIRTIAFHADERRFQLNGRTVPLNGAAIHHDLGAIGAAWNRKAQARRLRLLKEAGVNAIRSSHNPPDEGLLELCDEMGLLVKDEVFDEWRRGGDSGKRKNGYAHLFDAWHERDVRTWVQTDRNHPCVIMYSLGNEVCDLKPPAGDITEGTATARMLARIASEEDPTRPTTNGNNFPGNFTNHYPRVLGIMGCNYFCAYYPALKAKYPDTPFFGTETLCMSSTRGEYTYPVLKRWPKIAEVSPNRVNSSYCWEAAGWAGTLRDGWAVPPDVQWYWMDEVKTCMGEFIWTGIDYLGGPYWCGDWKRAIRTCNTGFLDSAGFRKDAFWIFQSRWRPDYAMAHILPHWNHAGREGQVTPVYVFTSGDAAELFLNGVSLGKRQKDPAVWNKAYRLCWDDVKYQPGRLEVVAYKNGKEWARDVVETTGDGVKVALTAEDASIVSDGKDLAYVTAKLLDAKGRVVPVGDPEVTFRVTGPGEIVATDNGDERDLTDFRSPSRKIFHGLAQVIVRAKEGAEGTITIEATGKGLEVGSCKVAVIR